MKYDFVSINPANNEIIASYIKLSHHPLHLSYLEYDAKVISKKELLEHVEDLEKEAKHLRQLLDDLNNTTSSWR